MTSVLQKQWWIQDFPWGSTNSQNGCGNLFFGLKLQENERIWIPRPPLDPPLKGTEILQAPFLYSLQIWWHRGNGKDQTGSFRRSHLSCSGTRTSPTKDDQQLKSAQ